MEDPDIRGLRLRSGKWSCTFTTGSFTYTRASAMKVSDDGKSFSALHLARPYVRVAPLDKRWKTEPDFGTLGSEGSDYKLAVLGKMAVVATTYSPALTSHTWRKVQPIAPWKMTELWLMTEHGMVGLIHSEAKEDSFRGFCAVKNVPCSSSSSSSGVGDSSIMQVVNFADLGPHQLKKTLFPLGGICS
jgi:hypothetical protein